MPIANVTAATPTTRAPRVIVARIGWATPGRDAEARGNGDRESESQPSQATAVAVAGRCRPPGDRGDRAEASRIDRRDDRRQQRDGDADREDERRRPMATT